MTNIAHNKKDDFELVKREVLYQGVFSLALYHIRHRLFNGEWSEVFQREMFERSSAAAVLPYDPTLDRVILIEQFRPGSIKDSVSPWLIEIPAGILTTEETPEALARREAMEEAGCDIKKAELICDYYVSPGGSNEYLHLFCGEVDAREISGIFGLKDEHEDIRVMNIPAEEAFALLNSGKIKTSPAMMSLYWLQIHRERLQATW